MKYLSLSLLALLASSACYSANQAACDDGRVECSCDAKHACVDGLSCVHARCVDPDATPDKSSEPVNSREDSSDTPGANTPDAPKPSGKPTEPAAKPVADAGTKAVDAAKKTVPCAFDQGPVQKLDLLFVVDNSNSMAQEQVALQAAFPRLVEALTNGRRSPGDPNPFTAATDLHVGVVSTDMGIPGVNFGAATNCRADGGDNARLQHTPRGQDCAPSYPSFLSYTAEGDRDTAGFSHDFACIAALGTGGCGFEQQLEAGLKALWPSVFRDQLGNVANPNPILFLSTTSQGTLGLGDLPQAQGGNAGFLRNDPKTGLSAIAIVLITDEEDCSSRTTEHLKPKDQYPVDSPFYNEDLNLRCYYNPQLLYDVTNRYLKGFQLLRQGNEQLVSFAAIVGVPTDLVTTDVIKAVDFSNAAERSKFYADILNDDRMTEKPDATAQPGMGNLQPSCARTDINGNVATAFPPRRIVTLAQAFGENGIVQSICQDDFGSAFDPIIDMIARRLGTKPACPR